MMAVLKDLAKMEWCPPKEWWKIHILHQNGKEHINVAFLKNPLNMYKTLRSQYKYK